MSGRPPWALTAAHIQLRLAVVADRRAIEDFLTEMDGEGLYQRHFAHGEGPNLALLARLDQIDGRDRVALVATDAARVIAHAEYVAQAGAAEFALMVLPGWRDRGLGSALLSALMDHAACAGVHQMYGLIQASNTRAVLVARGNGFRPSPGGDARTVIVSRTLTPERPRDRTGPGLRGANRDPGTECHDPDRTSLHRCAGP